MESFKESNPIRQACKAEILAAILFQRSQQMKKEKINDILMLLKKYKYDYILQNYLKIYYYNSPTEEGKQFELLLKENEFFNVRK